MPPGPHFRNPLQSTLAFRQDPLSFLSTLSQQYGDIYQFRLFTWPMIVLNHPHMIKHILQEKYEQYDKNVPFFDLGSYVAKEGLIVISDITHWKQYRRLMQPAFHKRQLSHMATTIMQETLSTLEEWDSSACIGQTINLFDEMAKLTLNISSTTLFGEEIDAFANQFNHAFATVNGCLADHLSVPFPPLSVPTPKHRRFWKALEYLHSVTIHILQQQRKQGSHAEGLLSFLLNATDEETGMRMSDQQICDQVMTFLIAGSETSAAALTWIWYLLSQHPQIAEYFYKEIDQCLGGKEPDIDDLPRLTYTRMIIDEALRLYPPGWCFMRRAIEDNEIGGYYIPKNSYILYSPYLLHHHPGLWEHPEQFRPERFRPEQKESYQPNSYIPFGAGPRKCIGEHMALLEMTLILATIAQRYRLHVPLGQILKPRPLLSLRPESSFYVSLQPRSHKE